MVPPDHATWIKASAIGVDPFDLSLRANRDQLSQLDLALKGARVICLGETNHFVHEKVAFRLCLLNVLAARGPIVIGEELGWADGQRASDFILGGDDTALPRAATFGYKGHFRPDRDDSPRGIFGRFPYPHDQMLAEHRRFYRALRALPNLQGYFGFDIDSPGAGYEDINTAARLAELPDTFWQGLKRVDHESTTAEADRLEQLLTFTTGDGATANLQQHLLSLIESLRYAPMVQDAGDYEAVRPAMAYRETTMKRRVAAELSRLPDDATLVLMGHAFHLARDDATIEKQGVGPGGDQVDSLGHYLSHRPGMSMRSVWMVYGGGQDSQPLGDLPTIANYPSHTINQILARHFSEPALIPITDDVRQSLASVALGHMYNSVVEVNLGKSADALMFFPEVSPLRP